MERKRLAGGQQSPRVNQRTSVTQVAPREEYIPFLGPAQLHVSPSCHKSAKAVTPAL